MSTTPKTVTTFLDTGNPTGWKIVEVSNWWGKAYIIPRKEIEDLLERDDLKSQSVYVLVGQGEKGQKIYIGEAEDFAHRIKYHQKNTPFWNIALCFIAKDDNLTKAHVQYLESRLQEIAAESNRVDMERGQVSKRPKLSEQDVAAMEEFISYIHTILATLGYVFLKPYREEQSSQPEETWYAQAKGRTASGVYTTEGFVVLKGSEMQEETSNTIDQSLLKKRTALIENNQVVPQGERYLFREDVVFSSPSTAASVVLGRNANGWT
jgi:hypothetical protein